MNTFTSSLLFQDRLIAKNAWRDYSTGANTNFAFEAFETEEKAHPPPVSSLPRPREMIGPSNGILLDDQIQHQHKFQHLEQQHSRNNIGTMVPGPRATYSLPRAPGYRHSTGIASSSGPQSQGYYTQDRRNMQRFKHPNQVHSSSQSVLPPQPDFYFMPSQRKYSGEVVRVYVDYGNPKNK